MITVYRILSYILLPIAILVGLFDLMFLMFALANPPMIIPAFLIACVVIYVICSFTFLIKGIDGRQRCKPSLKDWIRVNAFVCFIVIAFSIMSGVGMLSNPQLMQQSIDNAMAMQKSTEGLPSHAQMMVFMKSFLYGLLVFAFILLLHILISFRLLQAYRTVFATDNNQ